MWKLTIEDDEGQKTLLPLVHDEYHVGRSEENTIRLTDRNISRKHATLKRNGKNAWHLIDHESYNGCFVNGQRVIGSSQLTHSDLIQLGDYRIFVINEEAVVKASRSGLTPTPMPSAAKPNRLIVLTGPLAGLEFALSKEALSIGRAEDCGISINHPSVSRVHALVQSVGLQRYEVVDQGSANGVRVNGHDLRRGMLESGDLIELGDVKLRFLEKGQSVRLGGETISRAAPATIPDSISSARSLSAPGANPRTKRSSRLVALISVGAMALVLVTGFFYSRSFMSITPTSRSSNEIVSAAPMEDPALRTLEAARKAANAGDFESVLQHLDELPTGSPMRRMPEVGSLYSRWADWMLGQAEQTQDTAQKRALLGEVAKNSSVDLDRRKQASDALTKLDSSGTDVKSLPSVAPTATLFAAPRDLSTNAPPYADSKQPPISNAAERSAARERSAALRESRERERDKTTAAAAAIPETASVPPGVDVFKTEGEIAARKAIEGKVWSGHGTPDEVKLLKAICQHQGDTLCRDRATALLKQNP